MESSSVPRRPSLFPVLKSQQAASGVEGGAARANSLFPIGAQAPEPAVAARQHDWLTNTSFEEKLLPPQPLPPEEANISREDGDKEDASSASTSSQDKATEERRDEQHSKRKRRKKKKRKHKGSSAEDSSSGDEVRQKRKERKRRKKEKEKAEKERALEERLQLPSDVQRRAGAIWNDKKSSLAQDYFFDTKGDMDNLAFGSLYRLDVARYQRHLTASTASTSGRSARGPFSSEEDGAEGARNQGRYWAQPVKPKGIRIKRVQAARGSEALGNFIPLESSTTVVNVKGAESLEQSLLRKTREFNEQTRAKPHDVQLWLDFVAFQDEYLQLGRKKRLPQVLDKKTAILEKALEENSDSEELLLAYLGCCRVKDDSATLQLKWQKALTRLSGSYKLWHEYLRLRRGQFSTFSVLSIRDLHVQAVQALGGARSKARKEASLRGEESSNSTLVLEAERNMVALLLGACCFEWQTGHYELAVGLLQAVSEYAVFCPPVQVGEGSKQRLFELFWSSGAPRVGQEGGTGWASWLEKEEERKEQWQQEQKAQQQEEEKEVWPGWQPIEPPRKPEEDEGGGEGAPSESEGEEEQEEEAVQETDEEMLKRLGFNLEVGGDEVADAGVWQRWAKEEETRDREQWLPYQAPEAALLAPEEPEEGTTLQRTVLFDDVRDFLFSLDSDIAKAELLAEFASCCDAPIPSWYGSNDQRSLAKAEAAESASGTLLEHLQFATPPVAVEGLLEFEAAPKAGGDELARLVGGPSWLQEEPERRDFVQNLLVVASRAFPAFRPFTEGLLSLPSTEAGEDSSATARSLAKGLLKSRRQDLQLWGAYARLEALAGNVAAARKVYDTALASLAALPPDAKSSASVLYLAYADLELSQAPVPSQQCQVARRRALHILTCLGEGSPFTPLTETADVARPRLLMAKKGFQEMIWKVRSCAELDEAALGTVLSAALFERLLGGGWSVVEAVLQEGLSVGLPERRKRSLQYEKLLQRYVAMAAASATPKQQRQAVLRGLADYPHDSALLSSFVRLEFRNALANRLRRYFDFTTAKEPSTVKWLFALVCELGRPGAAPRLRNLFERALSAGQTSQSVVLWRLYLGYELEVSKSGSHRLEAARRVFFRALHACPWSKTLWLDGFRLLGKAGVLSGKELGELVDMMKDKELRLRTDVFEILLRDAEEDAAL